MTHEHTANEEARHGNREALEQVTRERDRLREALSLIAVVGYSEDPQVNAAIAKQTVDRARAALEDTHD